MKPLSNLLMTVVAAIVFSPVLMAAAKAACACCGIECPGCCS
jgi:hypothetical protein